MAKSNYFETTRCIIRSFEEKDLDVFVSYRNNMEWMIHQSYKGLTREEYKSQIVGDFNIDAGGQLAIISKYTDELLGDLYVAKTNNEISIGYAIHPRNSRQGYILEVVGGLVDLLLEKYPECDILADTTPGNVASIKLLKKIGFSSIKKDNETVYFIYKK